MGKVSIIIASAGELFLQRTVDGLLENCKGDIEILVFLDGRVADPPLKEDPRVRVIGSKKRVGIWEAINTSVALSTGEYIMKVDGHCILDEGFDEKLKAHCEDNWVCIPRRYSLEGPTWTRGTKKTDYMTITPPIEKPENGPRFWEWGFGGVRTKVPKERIIEGTELNETMTFQGSCWFMKKTFFNAIDGLTVPVSHWFEGINISLKTWLSGGKVIRNKYTWYAHLHKGNQYGRGYYISRVERDIDKKTVIDFWMNNKWDKRIHELKWLIDRFSPDKWKNWDWSAKWKS